MIIVIGALRARSDTIDEVLRLSLEHVRRSRAEPGCVMHSVHQDVEDPNRVVFIEYWDDIDALHEHFSVPASNAFVQALSPLAAEAPSLEIYQAERTR